MLAGLFAGTPALKSSPTGKPVSKGVWSVSVISGSNRNHVGYYAISHEPFSDEFQAWLRDMYGPGAVIEIQEGSQLVPRPGEQSAVAIEDDLEGRYGV